ncbi:MAG: type III pantothenate kinase [Gammaproteobacteria bacterium]|nr:type III pantothenate kinase [Gammaproteobacteria bacterium]
MKRLCIDVGNSRIKSAIEDEGVLTALPAVANVPETVKTSLDTAWQSQQAVDAIWCASVGHGQTNRVVEQWCEERYGLPVNFIKVMASAGGVTNAYRQQATLGVDRWLAAIAGFARHRQACVVFDCGTALTAEFVTAAGKYLGGAILPGPTIMSASLARGTAQLPAVDQLLEGVVGGDTAECIAVGIGSAIAGWFDRTIETARKIFGQPPVCILTGGGADSIRQLAPPGMESAPMLVVEGIALVARELR